MAKQSFDFLAGGATVSLAGFADQAETFERNTGQVHGLDCHVHAVDCSRVHEDELEIPQIGAEGYRACSFLRPFFTELDQAFPGKVLEFDLAQLGLQGIEGKLLGSPRRLAHVTHVLHVQVDQMSEQGGIPGRGLTWRLPQIDPALGGDGPFTGVFVAQEGLAGIGLLASDLNAPMTRFELGDRGQFVCALCALRGRSRAKSGEIQCTRECTRPVHVFDFTG